MLLTAKPSTRALRGGGELGVLENRKEVSETKANELGLFELRKEMPEPDVTDLAGSGWSIDFIPSAEEPLGVCF